MKRLVALPLLLPPLLATAAPARAVSSGAHAVGPTKTAWYDASYPKTTSPPPPLPPGVAADDLVVSGMTAASSALPVTPPTAAPGVRVVTALAALSFAVPEGTTAASLTLDLTSAPSTATAGTKAPTGVALEACPATSSFQAGGHQSFDKAPSYDCTGRTSLGALNSDGTAIVFSDIGRVAHGSLLSFAIRPATTGADRLVFAPPALNALSLLAFDAAPVFDAGGTARLPITSSPSTGGTTTLPSESVGAALPSVGSPVLTGSAPASTAPPVAPPISGTAAARALRQTLAVAGADDTRVRVVALAGVALLVSAVSLLAFTDRRPVEQAEWGFGRYRRPRQGQAPSL